MAAKAKQAKQAAAAAAAVVQQHAHVAQNAVGKHTASTVRQAKLAIPARSLRGINRNLRLCGAAGVTVTLVAGKGLCLQGGKAKGPQSVVVGGKPAPKVASLTYGQWVTAICKQAGVTPNMP